MDFLELFSKALQSSIAFSTKFFDANMTLFDPALTKPSGFDTNFDIAYDPRADILCSRYYFCQLFNI